MKTFLMAASLFVLGASSLAQRPDPMAAPDDVILDFHTEVAQHQFHLGESIPVTFSYRAHTPGKYTWVSLNKKLAGGSGLEVSCSPPAENAKLRFKYGSEDKFGKMLNSCDGVGGGIGSACGDCDWEHSLDDTALNFGGQALNSYVRFRAPGKYTCVAASSDITTASRQEKIRSALWVKSDPLDLLITEDPAWSHSAVTTYADAYEKLCRGVEAPDHPPFECGDIATRITYLDTLESLVAEVNFVDGRERGWDSGFWDAIQHTSFPVDAVRLMSSRMQDPDFQVSELTLRWLASSELQIDSPDALQTASPATYHPHAVEKMRKFVQLLGTSLSRKNSEVLIESAKTYSILANQEYCEGQPLISKEEQKQELAGIRRNGHVSP